MPLPPRVREMVEAKLDRYCKEKFPEKTYDHLNLKYTIRGNNVTLIEERTGIPGLPVGIELKVAQFRFDPKTKKWTLFCKDRNERWHEHIDSSPTKSFDRLIRDIEEDCTGIFWG